MSITDIDRAAARYADAVVELTESFISVPTENPPGVKYTEFLDLLKGELSNLDIAYEVVPISGGDLPRWAVIAEAGSGDTAFQLHGHYDVVPAFRNDQFTPVRKNGELWGRGATDMKGGLAAQILAAAAVRDSGLGRVRLMIVPDEETGGELGAGWMKRNGLLTTPDVRAVIVGEPTGSMIWHGCRGAISMRVTVHGKASHVGLHYNGHNAFEGMADLVGDLRALGKGVAGRITELNISPDEARASIMLLGGESSGGVNFNVVPEVSTFTIDRRFNPEEERDTVLAEMVERFEASKSRGHGVDWDIFQDEPAADEATDSTLAVALADNVEAVTGSRPPFEMCPGLLEIRFYSGTVPVMCYGPGVVATMHGPTEHVTIENLQQAVRVYARTAVSV